MIEQLLVKPEPQDYFYIAQGMLTIDNVDDGEEMKLTDKAFDTLNFEMVRFRKIFYFMNLIYLILNN